MSSKRDLTVLVDGRQSAFAQGSPHAMDMAVGLGWRF